MADQTRGDSEIGGDATQRHGGQALGSTDLDGLGQQLAMALGGQLSLRVPHLDGQFLLFLLTDGNSY